MDHICHNNANRWKMHLYYDRTNSIRIQLNINRGNWRMGIHVFG